MSRKATSKAKYKRTSEHRLRQMLKRVEGITRMGTAIIHANWGTGPDRQSFRERYSTTDE